MTRSRDDLRTKRRRAARQRAWERERWIHASDQPCVRVFLSGPHSRCHENRRLMREEMATSVKWRPVPFSEAFIAVDLE